VAAVNAGQAFNVFLSQLDTIMLQLQDYCNETKTSFSTKRNSLSRQAENGEEVSA